MPHQNKGRAASTPPRSVAVHLGRFQRNARRRQTRWQPHRLRKRCKQPCRRQEPRDRHAAEFAADESDTLAWAAGAAPSIGRSLGDGSTRSFRSPDSDWVADSARESPNATRWACPAPPSAASRGLRIGERGLSDNRPPRALSTTAIGESFQAMLNSRIASEARMPIVRTDLMGAPPTKTAPPLHTEYRCVTCTMVPQFSFIVKPSSLAVIATFLHSLFAKNQSMAAATAAFEPGGTQSASAFNPSSASGMATPCPARSSRGTSFSESPMAMVS